MWKFAETNWSILAGHVCTPFVIEQKRNIFSGKWEHKYHKLAWSIWPLDLLHMCVSSSLGYSSHPPSDLCTLVILSNAQSSAEMCLKKDLSDCVESNQAKQQKEGLWILLHTYKIQISARRDLQDNWLVLLATLNVTGKEELLAKRVQSVVLFTPRARPQFSPICRRLVAPMQHKLVTDFL